MMESLHYYYTASYTPSERVIDDLTTLEEGKKYRGEEST